MKPIWIKITVSFTNGVDLTYVAPPLIKAFGEKFKVEHMYFCRYVNLTGNTFELSALTDATTTAIRKFFRCQSVTSIKIENRGSGSLAHALAYRVVSGLDQFNVDEAEGWNRFLDVVHWMCNMRGYDYVREIRFYNYAAYCFANQVIKNNDPTTAALRNSPTVVEFVKELERKWKANEDKAQAGTAVSASGRGSRPSPVKSARAASRKVRGS